MPLTVSIVRHRGQRDRIFVTRGDGSETSWRIPTSGDRLPHDLCHLVVEEALGIRHGFWGMVADGVDVKLVDNQPTLTHDGVPVVDQPGFVFDDLNRAESAVALICPPGLHVEEVGLLVVAHMDSSATSLPPSVLPVALGFDRPDFLTDEVIVAVRRRLADLTDQWRDLADGGSITLAFKETAPVL